MEDEQYLCLPSPARAPLGLPRGLSPGFSGLPELLSACLRYSRVSGGCPGASGAAPSAPGLLPAPLRVHAVYMPEGSFTHTLALSQRPEAILSPAKVFTILFFSCSPPHLTLSQEQLGYCHPSVDHDIYTSHNIALVGTPERHAGCCLCRKNRGQLLLSPQSTPTSRHQFATS